VKYTISSPLDIQTGDMTNLFHRLCEKYYRSLNPKVYGIKEREEAQLEVHSALLLAMRADNQMREMNPSVDRTRWYDLGDWAISEAFGGSALT